MAVVPLDDFQVILGFLFLITARAAPLPEMRYASWTRRPRAWCQ